MSLSAKTFTNLRKIARATGSELDHVRFFEVVLFHAAEALGAARVVILLEPQPGQIVCGEHPQGAASTESDLLILRRLLREVKREREVRIVPCDGGAWIASPLARNGIVIGCLSAMIAEELDDEMVGTLEVVAAMLLGWIFRES